MSRAGVKKLEGSLGCLVDRARNPEIQERWLCVTCILLQCLLLSDLLYFASKFLVLVRDISGPSLGIMQLFMSDLAQ